jgi:hypothetical protein
MKLKSIVGNAEMAANRETAICPTEYTVVLEKFAVDTMLFEHVQDNFNDILPLLLVGVEYTDEDLIGASLWTELTCFAQRKAHLCLKHLATMPGTRLTDMANESCNKTTFRID